ncbi:Hypothetical protein PBC10988_38750 [Planctomycetales bacterium 10988]|nr:Hypothetical protein PBC10988_38750 [Planctomycetales bacterium 10988]
MGLSSDFFLAEGSNIPEYDGGVGFPSEEVCQFRDISPLQGEQFWAVLRNEDYNPKKVGEFRLVTAEDAEDWTMQVPTEMVDLLAQVEESEVPGLAEKFSQATYEELEWPPFAFVAIITELSNLARRAKATGKTMYLWNSL